MLERVSRGERGPAGPEARCARSGARSSPPRSPSSTRCPSPTSARPATFTHQAAMRRFGSSAQLRARAEHRRHLRRGRARPRGVRRGAGGELDGGRGQRHARPPHRLRAHDHRRDDARHRAAPAVARGGPRARSRSSARTRRRSRSAGSGSPRTCPTSRVEEMPSTTASAERAQGRSDGGGGSPPRWPPGLYDVPVLRARIEDNPSNSTRFLVIGRRAVPPTGRDKTSILFSMKNEPGVLYSILAALRRARRST